MLRTNSKQAKENIRKYILDNFDYDNYIGYNKDVDLYAEIVNNGGINPQTGKKVDLFSRAKHIIKYIAYSEVMKWHKGGQYNAFKDWCQGLPSLLDTCYYYNRSAKKDLAQILEETEEEADKFTEEQAEEKLTYLIYREVFN